MAPTSFYSNAGNIRNGQHNSYGRGSHLVFPQTVFFGLMSKTIYADEKKEGKKNGTQEVA
jgi:hypothetical protein